MVREVGDLARRAEAQHKRLATLGIDAEIAFASADARAAFAEELAASVTALAAKYHATGGRPHRLVVAVHPTAVHPTPDPEEPATAAPAWSGW